MNRVIVCFLLLFGAPMLPLSWSPSVRAGEPATAAAQSAPSAKGASGQSAAGPKVSLVYLVQHTHTDIGYTRRQSEILPEHLRFIDYALDCCDQTDSYADDAKFRWTCESSWVVREYLKRRPAAQIERFKKRVAEGRIEVTAMALNMSEIATESSLAASLQVIHELKDEFGIPTRLAMQDDVNGAAWCLVDYFPDCGVRYLTMGINKTRSLLPFDRPTAFWWESPSGKRVLAFRAEHYMAGNNMGIHDGNVAVFEKHLLGYLSSLEQRGYPFDRASLQYSGLRTDNSPPVTTACDVIKQWNETHESPKLRSATASEFMDYVSARYGESLPACRVAWPDWWTDGFGSAARETAESRVTHSGMQATQGLLAMALLSGSGLPPAVGSQVAAAQEQLLFYDEHTYGAAASISAPTAESTLVQWAEKSSYVWDAVKQAGMLREEALGVLGDGLPPADAPTLVVFNTLNWKRSGMIRVFLDGHVVPPGREACFTEAQTGEVAPARLMEKGHGGAYWNVWTKDVPPLGYKSYRIRPGDATPPEPAKSTPPPQSIESMFYKLALDPTTGAITSLIDKEAGVELVDRTCPWQLGQLIYERHEKGREFKRDAFRRTTVRNVKLQAGADGPIWSSILVKADLDGCAEPGSVHADIRLFKTEKRIEFHFGMRKLPVTDPEAVYVAFPFQRQDGKVFYEAQGGTVEPGVDQLPGSSSDWHTVQNFIAVRNGAGQIVCGSDEVPLVQFGDLNLGKWQPVAKVEKPHVYSWVMNNYWYTNFRATQEGEFNWSYFLTSSREDSNAAAARFGWGSRVPLVARVLPRGEAGHGKLNNSLLRCDAANLLLIESRPARDGKGVILHWREVDGKQATLDLGGQPFASRLAVADEINVLEETLKAGVSSISFAPFEVKFLRLSLK